MPYLFSSFATRVVDLSGLLLVAPLSPNVRTFHDATVIECLDILFVFRTPFLVSSSFEVSSAILNRAAQSLKSVPDGAAASFPASNDQYSELPVWRFVSATSSVTTPVNFDTRQSLLGF